MSFSLSSIPIEIRPGLSTCNGLSSSGERVKVLLVDDENVLNGLLKYRHPCLLTYVGHKREKGQLVIAIESAEPLKLDAHTHPLRKIGGLWSVLQAVEFLYTRASVSLPSLSLRDVFVSRSGKWKLLPVSTIPLQLDDGSKGVKNFLSFAEEILEPHFDEYPVAQDFISISKPAGDVSFSDLQAHPLFAQNDYVKLLESLHMLPMKAPKEKGLFFKTVGRTLYELPETVWSQELLGLLCSRLVFIDTTARRFLLPHLLTPRSDNWERNEQWVDGAINPLVPGATFKRYCVPLLETAFKVKDVSVRMTLLENLPRYVAAIPENTLRNDILPEILCGVKDISDTIVSMSLKSLSLLVPILGASAVVGPNRKKIFSDGRPKGDPMFFGNPVETFPERSSPDGGEVIAFDHGPMSEPNQAAEWSDWGDTPVQPKVETPLRSLSPEVTFQDFGDPITHGTPTPAASASPLPLKSPKKTTVDPQRKIPSLNEDALDIKTLDWKVQDNEEDFFKDMEPKYEVKATLPGPLPEVEDVVVEQVNTKLAMTVIGSEDTEGPGWGEEGDENGDWNWDEN